MSQNSEGWSKYSYTDPADRANEAASGGNYGKMEPPGRTMTCPRCGAPMTIRSGRGQCEYCDYETVEESTAGSEKYSYENQRSYTAPPVGSGSPDKYAYTYRRVQADPSASPKSRTVALALCLFVGVFGVHRFYAGRIISGIIYLLTLGLLGFGVLIDLILILLGKFRDRHHRPLVNW